MSSEYKVIYSPKAAEDLTNIYSYISYRLHSPDIAKNQINSIRNEIRSLRIMPFRYAAYDRTPWGKTGLRKMPVGNYIVLYLPDSEKKTVTVIRIVYGGRDIDEILQNNITRS